MRAKLLLLAGTALSGALALIAGSQTWVSFMLEGTHSLETVTGHAVNPALSPIVIALVAASLVLTIAGPVFRRVLGGVIALLGGGVIALTVSVLADPLGAITGKITELTGIAGASSVSLVTWSQVSGWVYAVIAAGVLAVLCGVAVLVTGGRWATSGRKYEAGSLRAGSGGSDRISDWDALSGGDDPTD